MLLALVPAFGAIAYVASDTMTKRGLGRLLVDQAAYKMPFGLYRRLGLARVTAPRLPQAAVRQPREAYLSYQPALELVPVRIDD